MIPRILQVSLLWNNIMKLNIRVPLYVTLHTKNTLPARWMENVRKSLLIPPNFYESQSANESTA
jgi:hypothetical protein